MNIGYKITTTKDFILVELCTCGDQVFSSYVFEGDRAILKIGENILSEKSDNMLSKKVVMTKVDD